MKIKYLAILFVIYILQVFIGIWIYDYGAINMISLFWGCTIPLSINSTTFLVAHGFFNINIENITQANVFSFLLRMVLYLIIIVVLATFVNIKFISFIFSFTLTFIFLTILEALYLYRSVPK